MSIHQIVLGLWFCIGVLAAGAPAQDAGDAGRKSVFDFDENEMDETKPADSAPADAAPPDNGAKVDQPAQPRTGRSQPGRRTPVRIEKVSVPDAKEVESARKLVLEAFPDLRNTNVTDRDRALLQVRAQARDKSCPPAQRYALLDAMRQSAEEIGHVTRISLAIAEMDRYFTIDPLAMQMESVGRLNRSVDPLVAANFCLHTVEYAVRLVRPFEAEQVLRMVEPLLAKSPKENASHYRQQKETLERVLPALKALRNRMDDPAANLAVGWYVATAQRHWTVALPMLAKGSDPSIKAAAERELAMPSETAAQMEVASGWWEISDGKTLSEAERASVKSHASEWYEQARRHLQGMERILADKRIEQATAANMAPGRKPPSGTTIIPTPGSIKPAKLDEFGGHGLLCEIFAGRDLKQKIAERIDPRIDAFFGMGVPCPEFAGDSFSMRWSGYIRAPRAGVFMFGTRADDGIRLWIDDKLVIDAWDSNNEQSAVMQLTGRPQKIKCEYNDTGGGACVVLQWRDVDTKTFITIDDRYFFTDEKTAARDSLGRVIPSGGQGLNMAVFGDEKFGKALGTTVDRQVNAFIRNGPIAESAPADNFSVRWQGYLLAPSAGTYKFIVEVDDDIRLYVNKKLMLDERRPGRREAIVDLPNMPVDIMVEFVEQGGPGRISLHWEQINGFKEQIIPPSAFYRSREAAMKAVKK